MFNQFETFTIHHCDLTFKRKFLSADIITQAQLDLAATKKKKVRPEWGVMKVTVKSYQAQLFFRLFQTHQNFIPQADQILESEILFSNEPEEGDSPEKKPVSQLQAEMDKLDMVWNGDKNKNAGKINQITPKKKPTEINFKYPKLTLIIVKKCRAPPRMDAKLTN